VAGSRDRWEQTWLRFSGRDGVNTMRGLEDIVNIPFITTDQMREVDRAMIEDYGISLVQMMENAGRNLAQLARGRFLQGDPTGRRVLVLAGKGGNGGGGMVCARRLHDWGAEVQLWMTAPGKELAGVPLQQLGVLERMGIPTIAAGESSTLPPADLLVDALIGYSLTGPPRGLAANLIDAANNHGAPILSLDVPSGVDSATGAATGSVIRATATMTLAMPKVGFEAESARRHIGELYLADISVPPELYAKPPLNLDVPNVFAEDDIVRLW